MSDNKYNQFNIEYLQKRSEDWPFLKVLQKQNTIINAVYKEIIVYFNNFAHKENYSYDQYEESLNEALSIFYNINRWVKESLGKENIDSFINKDGMDDYVDDYHKYWFHQEYSFEQYSSLDINFPNNIETLLPDIIDYLECPYLDSKIVSWSLVDLIIFTELKAQSSSIYFNLNFYSAINKIGILDKLFDKKRKKAIEKLDILLHKLYNVYLQCDLHMFHPQVIKELCIEIRKDGDYYDGILFTILENMIERKQSYILL